MHPGFESCAPVRWQSRMSCQMTSPSTAASITWCWPHNLPTWRLRLTAYVTFLPRRLKRFACKTACARSGSPRELARTT